MWRATVGLLNSSAASGPSSPFALLASWTLCQALKFSICVQLTHAAVKPQGTPPARSFFAASNVSGQVLGGLSGSSPAFLKASLFQYTTGVELLNGIDNILPSGVL